MSNLRLSKGTVCQYLGYLYFSENLNWAARNLQLGRGLDIAALVECTRKASEVTNVKLTLNEKLTGLKQQQIF